MNENKKPLFPILETKRNREILTYMLFGIVSIFIIIVSFKFAPKIMYKLLFEKQVIETIKEYQGK